jgi:hypothetical protein
MFENNISIELLTVKRNPDFKSTQIRSKVTDNPIDLGLFVMFSINPIKRETAFRNEFYLNEEGKMVYELYVDNNLHWITQTIYEVV